MPLAVAWVSIAVVACSLTLLLVWACTHIAATTRLSKPPNGKLASRGSAFTMQVRETKRNKCKNMWSASVVRCGDKKDQHRTYCNNSEVEVSRAILQSKVSEALCWGVKLPSYSRLLACYGDWHAKGINADIRSSYSVTNWPSIPFHCVYYVCFISGGIQLCCI